MVVLLLIVVIAGYSDTQPHRVAALPKLNHAGPTIATRSRNHVEGPTSGCSGGRGSERDAGGSYRRQTAVLSCGRSRKSARREIERHLTAHPCGGVINGGSVTTVPLPPPVSAPRLKLATE
jgi:hypothetical protein